MQYVKDGKIAATVMQFPLIMATRGVDAVVDYVKTGKKPSGFINTGATLTIENVSPDYAQMEHDHDIAEIFRENARAVGRPESHEGAGTFSTDMGNVSLAMPSIHPCLGIDTGGAVNHQPEFAAAAVNASADRAIVEGAIGMAWTVVDIATGGARDRLLARGGYRR